MTAGLMGLACFTSLLAPRQASLVHHGLTPSAAADVLPRGPAPGRLVGTTPSRAELEYEHSWQLSELLAGSGATLVEVDCYESPCIGVIRTRAADTARVAQVIDAEFLGASAGSAKVGSAFSEVEYLVRPLIYEPVISPQQRREAQARIESLTQRLAERYGRDPATGGTPRGVLPLDLPR